jgi:acyl carrier protein
MELQEALLQSIERICGVSRDEVRPEAGLEDLGIDSLTVAELITDLEIRLGVELPMDVLRRMGQLRTVGEVEQHLRTALAEPDSAR